MYSSRTICLGLFPPPPPKQLYDPVWLSNLWYELYCNVLLLNYRHYIYDIDKNWIKKFKHSIYVKFNAIIVMLILWWCIILSCTDIMMSSNNRMTYFFSSSVRFTMFNCLLIWQGTSLLSCNHWKHPSLLMQGTHKCRIINFFLFLIEIKNTI